MFGVLITLIESWLLSEFEQLKSSPTLHEAGNTSFLIWNLVGFSMFNFVCYSFIPYFVQRSGATLLNVSNVTTVIWSMLADILLFRKPFYFLNVIAFILELTGIVIFSLQKPVKKQNEDPNPVQQILEEEGEL